VYSTELLNWLATTRPARRLADVLFRARSRRLLARFDQQSPGRCQTRTLLGLLHRAQKTRFGRDHDFRRIRTVADFRRLVPLCTPDALWRSYWHAVFPCLDGATWPGPLPTAQAETKLRHGLPSLALHAAHCSAFSTAVALALHACPQARFCSGQVLFLRDDMPLSLEEAVQVPALLRPYALTGLRAEQAAQEAVTLLAGPADRLVRFLQLVKEYAGDDRLERVWPSLAVLLAIRPSATGTAARLRAEAGKVQVLETVLRPEGPLAIEDPRHGALRMLPDHGVYFEFVPAEEASKPEATRHGLDEVEPGVVYELAVTSPAGLWACRMNLAICFEGRDPPMVRYVEEIAPTVAVPVRPEGRPVVISPPPHRQNGGSPAALPESFVHSPWSTLADRG
jgi:hypothetical protein